ncbi:hypothetical protein M5K25_005285 [Dendrobium thyrsiflorum]|uniref:Reverse transcriptase zinc-binding domain-containing protein n=1 Tax=Dendrobium thyrsiflorum TaxID=117978 RepID=A0ABD0VH29_DENTH
MLPEGLLNRLEKHGTENIEDGRFLGIELQGFKLTHLLYADDLLVFGKATANNCRTLSLHLSTFAKASGLAVNYEKSSLLLPKLVANTQDIISAIPICNTCTTLTYLGIPISDKCLRVADFLPLVEKITRKLSGWKASMLSFAGRLQFLKFTILNSIAYWIRGSILPKTILKAIRKLFSKFLFYGDISLNRRLYMISWEKVCIPKSCGGLGLYSPAFLQFSFNCSLISRLYNNVSPLGRWFLMRYTSPWRPPPAYASKFWCMVCSAAQIAKPHFKFRITPAAPIAFFGTIGLWVLPRDLDTSIANQIKTIPIFDDVKPCLLWENNSIGHFGAFSKAYYDSMPSCTWANHIWFKGYALRYSIFSWLYFVGGLKTAKALSQRNIHIDPTCPLCNSEQENSTHLFFECHFSFKIIVSLIPQAASHLLRPSVIQLFEWFEEMDSSADMLRLHKIITCCAIYAIWKERNGRRYGGHYNCSNTVIKLIKSSIFAKVSKWKHGIDLLDRLCSAVFLPPTVVPVEILLSTILFCIKMDMEIGKEKKISPCKEELGPREVELGFSLQEATSVTPWRAAGWEVGASGSLASGVRTGGRSSGGAARLGASGWERGFRPSLGFRERKRDGERGGSAS